MDFSTTSVTPCPSTTQMAGTLIALLFPFLALPPAIHARRLGAAFTMVPLLAIAAAACLQLVHVVAAMAVTGVGTGAAVAAGLASVQASLVFGAFISTLTALIAAFVASRHPVDAKPNRIAFALAVVATAIVIVEPALAFVFFRVASIGLFLTLATLVALGAVAALFASRGAAVRSLLVAAGVAASVGVEAWLVMRHFQHIALYGR